MEKTLIQELTQIGVDVQERVPLSQITTFRLGGPCPLLVTCQNSQQLILVIKVLLKARMDFMLMGGGSNIVVSDSGVQCAVVCYRSARPSFDFRGDTLCVEACSWLDDLVLFAAQNGRTGLNFLSGIPGTVGGAIVGNAGAFGKQVSDSLQSVSLLNREGHQREVFPHDLNFQYRDSALKTSGEIVLSARFHCPPAPQGAQGLFSEREEIMRLRKEKHPDVNDIPSAGSFFRNVEPSSQAARRQAAGWFLEQSGAKEFSCGGAAVFSRHANIIINTGSATAQDVYRLSQKMAEAVQKKFNLQLIREVRFVGDIAGAESHHGLIW